MRQLTTHIVDGDVPQNQIRITVVDGPGAGGANHLYSIEGFDTATNPSDPFTVRHGQSAQHSTVLFQNGPIKEAGVNGITQEALLAIIIDRLEGFQAGNFASPDNADALGFVKSALACLHKRTQMRLRRGVEGADDRMSDEPRPVVTDDGNQRLSVIEQTEERDAKDYPALNISHLQMPAIVAPDDNSQRIAREIDVLLPRPLRARAVGAGMYKALEGNPVLLYELYLLGEKGFIAKMKETNRPDSLADGLTDAELGLSWEVFVLNVKRAADAGAKWRKRKDWRG